MRPLVALLKWLTTERLPSTSCSTRTVATRRAGSAGGRQNAAYMPERRSTSRPLPDGAGHGRAEGARARRRRPSRGRAGMASPESRYAGIRSPGRTSPKRLEVTATPRRGAALGGRGQRREAEGVVEDAGVDGVGASGRRRCAARALRATRSSCDFGTPRVLAATSGSPRAELDERGEHRPRGPRSARGSRGRSRSSGLPRRGADLPSLGGRRMSIGARLWCACRATASSGSGPRRQRCRRRPCTRGIAAIQAELEVTPGLPARGRGGRRAGRGRARGCPTSTAPTSPFVTIDPDDVDGPRPGAAHRARRRRRLRRALRDRRRRGVRHRRRPGRPRGAPPRRDALRRRLQGAAAPEGALRGRRVAAARPGAPGAALDDPARRRRRAPRRRRSSGRGCARPPSCPTTAPRRCSTTAPPPRRWLLLKEVGAAAGRRARPPAAASRCRCPSRRSTSTDGHWHLTSASMLPVEEWNAQISLLTGFAAASLMVYARVGLLRTLPAARPARRAAPAPHRPRARHRVARRACSTPTSSAPSTRPAPSTPRWSWPAPGCCAAAAYVGFDGEVPADPQHAALASEYAHVTAPLRRLGDRYAGEVCVALCAGTDVPDWVLTRAARPAGRAAGLGARAPTPTSGRSSTSSRPALLAGPGRRGVRRGRHQHRREAPDAGHGHRAQPRRRGPGVRRRRRAAGHDVRVRLDSVDVETRKVRFTLCG